MLDIKTLSIVQSIMLSVQMIILFIQYRMNNHIKETWWWAFGSLMLAGGILFMPLVNYPALIFFAAISNPMYISGYLMIYIGVTKYVDKNISLKQIGALFIVFCLLYYSFIFLWPNLMIRTLLVHGTLAIINLNIAYIVLLRVSTKKDYIRIFTGGIFLLAGFLFSLRVAILFFTPALQNYDEQSVILGLSFLLPTIFSNMWTFGLVLLVNQRLNTINNADKDKIRRLMEELEYERDIAQLNALTDSLTGLANRRMFDESLFDIFYKLQNKDQLLSLIMIDIDHFKPFNDLYGHLVGDYVLEELGELLGKIIMDESHLVARFGGEEFVVILPDTNCEEASALALHICSEVKKVKIVIENDVELDAKLAVSIGVVTVSPSEYAYPKDVLNLADKALYLAKENGRDRVEILTNILNSAC